MNARFPARLNRTRVEVVDVVDTPCDREAITDVHTQENGIGISMSRKGNPWDSFNRQIAATKRKDDLGQTNS